MNEPGPDSKSDQTRCGFVAVIGAPNAGKSTLINALVGSKVSIVSPKVQTTRTLVRGITVHQNSQVIFVDTPGIFTPKERLERAMVAAAWEGQGEADIVVLIIDAGRRRVSDELRSLIEKLSAARGKQRCVLVLNKIDTVKKEDLFKLTIALNELMSFDATFMISALKEDGTADLLGWLAAAMPEGPFHYPEDQVSDMPMRLLAAEITREKLFHRLHQELPYGLTVETESWEQFDNGDIKIGQVVYIAREAHKKIIIGKGGAQLGKVGSEARVELEEILETRVHLNLFVKVRERWLDDPERYQIWGLDSSA